MTLSHRFPLAKAFSWAGWKVVTSINLLVDEKFDIISGPQTAIFQVLHRVHLLSCAIVCNTKSRAIWSLFRFVSALTQRKCYTPRSHLWLQVELALEILFSHLPSPMHLLALDFCTSVPLLSVMGWAGNPTHTVRSSAPPPGV